MRYVRTGEFRSPNPGDWFEGSATGGMAAGPILSDGGYHNCYWILRAIPEGQAFDVPPALSAAINAVLDATTLPEISDAVEALRKCWRKEE